MDKAVWMQFQRILHSKQNTMDAFSGCKVRWRLYQCYKVWQSSTRTVYKNYRWSIKRRWRIYIAPQKRTFRHRNTTKMLGLTRLEAADCRFQGFDSSPRQNLSYKWTPQMPSRRISQFLHSPIHKISMHWTSVITIFIKYVPGVWNLTRRSVNKCLFTSVVFSIVNRRVRYCTMSKVLTQISS